jgi:hypothetical protein
VSTLKTFIVNNNEGDLPLKVGGNTIVEIKNTGDVKVKRNAKAAMFQTVNVIEQNYTLEDNRSSMSVGPVTIRNADVTVSNNSVWIIV